MATDTPSTQAPPAVEARGLTFSYGALRVLNGLSFAVRDGEIFGLLGANGSGKTTLMRLMVGLLRHDGGSLTVYVRRRGPARDHAAGRGAGRAVA